MTVPQGNGRFSCHVGRIRSSVPLRPTFEDDETWYCGTAIAVPYAKLHKVLAVTGYYTTMSEGNGLYAVPFDFSPSLYYNK